MVSKKIAAVVMIAALSIGGMSSAVADTGHIVGVPPHVKTVLDQLVTNKTITQAQEDAITGALTAAAQANPKPALPPKEKDMDNRPMGPRGGFGLNSAAREAIITSTLGITAADLKAARLAGKSLAQLAGAKTDALITALVNYDSTQIDAAVTAGTLTSDQATKMKANLKTRVTNEVNRVAPLGGHEGKRGMGMAPKIPAPAPSTGSN